MRRSRNRAAWASALALLVAVLPAPVLAAEIRVGEKLPDLRIDDLGECVLRDGETTFEPWDTSRLPGKIRLFQYVAARVGASDVHEPLYDAARAAGFPPGAWVDTKIVNADDSLWGTAGLVAPNIEAHKKELPARVLVVDAKGVGRRRWDLAEGGSTVALLDASGKVLFVTDDEPTEKQIEEVLRLIRERVR